MKKSKEFWVDHGYFDMLYPHAQAKEFTVIQKDAYGAVGALFFFLGSAILAATGVGVAIAIVSITAGQALYSVGLTAAIASMVPW